jgi:hypothetical protein
MLPDLFTDPRAYLALVAVVVAVLYWQRTLSWAEYTRVHALKRRVLPLVDRYTALFVVSRKGGRDDPEFITSYDGDVQATFNRLVANGGSPHVINSLKVRRQDGRNKYSDAHVLWTHNDGTQTEAYLFGVTDSETDVYAHHEAGVQTPKDHLQNTNQSDGDPRGVVRMALGMADELEAEL